jgi:hypothetical protein
MYNPYTQGAAPPPSLPHLGNLLSSILSDMRSACPLNPARPVATPIATPTTAGFYVVVGIMIFYTNLSGINSRSLCKVVERDVFQRARITASFDQNK